MWLAVVHVARPVALKCAAGLGRHNGQAHFLAALLAAAPSGCCWTQPSCPGTWPSCPTPTSKGGTHVGRAQLGGWYGAMGGWGAVFGSRTGEQRWDRGGMAVWVQGRAAICYLHNPAMGP